MAKPLLVIVSGKPASGKSTMARHLADRSRLWLPVISHDAIRSGLRRSFGVETNSGVPAEASIGLYFDTIARLLEAGLSLVIELSFRRGLSEPDLLPLTQLADSVNIHCQLSVDQAHRRFVERAQALGPSMFSHLVEQMDAGTYDWSVFDPLELGIPRLLVDTADGYSPGLDEVVAFCRTATLPA